MFPALRLVALLALGVASLLANPSAARATDEAVVEGEEVGAPTQESGPATQPQDAMVFDWRDSAFKWQRRQRPIVAALGVGFLSAGGVVVGATFAAGRGTAVLAGFEIASGAASIPSMLAGFLTLDIARSRVRVAPTLSALEEQYRSDAIGLLIAGPIVIVAGAVVGFAQLLQVSVGVVYVGVSLTEAGIINAVLARHARRMLRGEGTARRSHVTVLPTAFGILGVF